MNIDRPSTYEDLSQGKHKTDRCDLGTRIYYQNESDTQDAGSYAMLHKLA